VKFSRQSQPRGVALIIVMVVILSLTVLVAGFAYSMKVEVKLARNNNVASEMEWLGRSGVEFAKYVLAMQRANNSEPYDSLNQKWAGGPGSTFTNALMEDFSLENNVIGNGTFSVKIVDLERKMNINFADPPIIQQALKLMGVDAAEAFTVSDSIEDWRDPNVDPRVKRMNGAKNDYYLKLKPAYFCKNGPLDDLSELLLVQGVTPAMYWGPRAAGHLNQGLLSRSTDRRPGQQVEPSYSVGFVDLFTTLSARFININTASAEVFQLIPGIDPNRAQEIIRMRAGPDGVDGTQDDVPFHNPGEFVRALGANGPAGQAILGRNIFNVRSTTFEVTVTAQMGDIRREYVAVIQRPGAGNLAVLSFYWR
jgi:general secretion pathway protein K